MNRAVDSWRWLLLLVVPSLVRALGVMARNPVGIPHAERLLAVSLATWLIACLLALLLQVWEVTPIQSTTVAFVATVVFYWGGDVLDPFGDIGGLLLVMGLLVGLGVLIARTRSEYPLKIVLVAVSVGLLSGPIVDLGNSMAAFGANTVDDEKDLNSAMAEKPDVWLVVLDGHPGVPAMKLDFGLTAIEELEESLEAAGLSVHESAWSAFWTTDFSLPSILNMGYPTEDPIESDATKRALYEIVGGNNRLTDMLASNGYETYMVESGWSGSACSTTFDHCIPSTWMDEPMFFMLAESLVSDFLLSRHGYAFTAGAASTMEWALKNGESIAEDGAPSFVFAHVLAPHPPFLLDASCRIVYSNERAGVTFNRANIPPSEREEYLVAQMSCIRDFVVELSGRVGEDSVFVVVSDHGTDRRNQLITDPAVWGHDATVERMSVFLATTESACRVADGVLLPNLMRQVLSCYSSDGIEDVQDHMFTGYDVELSPQQMRAVRGVAGG